MTRMHVIALLSAMLLPNLALAEKRVALIIGNSSYEAVATLPNATNDADVVAAAFMKAGIKDVTIAKDQSRSDLSRTLRNLAEKADNNDWAVIYYAGHGIEIYGKNYLLPTDAGLARDRDVQFEAIGLDEVMSTSREPERSASCSWMPAVRTLSKRK